MIIRTQSAGHRNVEDGLWCRPGWWVGLVALLVAGLVAGLLVPTAAGAAEVTGTANGLSDSIRSHGLASQAVAMARPGDPLGEKVVVGRSGSAVWAAGWSLAESSDDVAVRVSGLPEGVGVSAASVPSFVDGARAAQVQGCEVQDGAAVCRVSSGEPDAYESISALLLTADGSAAQGSAAVQVSLLAAGQVRAETVFSLTVSAKPVERVLAARTGDRSVQVGDIAELLLDVYRLAGSAKADVTTVKNPVTGKLRQAGKVRSKDWDCSGSTCATRGVVAVGASAEQLRVVVKPSKRDLKGLKESKGSVARQVTWKSKVALASQSKKSKKLAGTALEQSLALIPAPRKVKQDPIPVNAIDKARRPMMDVRLVPVARGRVGGKARYKVLVNNGGARPAKKVRVGLRLPAASKFSEVKTPGAWKRSGSGLVWPKQVAGHRALPPVEIEVRSTRTQVNAAARPAVGAEVSWTGRGLNGKRAVDRAVSEPWLQPLSVSMDTTNTVVHSESGVTTVLSAKVGSLAGEKYRYSFSQFCRGGAKPGSKSCPRVSFDAESAGESTKQAVTTSFRPPRVTSATKLHFRVQVTANSATVTDTIALKARPVKGEQARWDGRVDTSQPPSEQEVAAALTKKVPGAQYVQHQTEPVAKVWINKKSPISSYKKRVKLKVNLKALRGEKRARVKQVRWRVDGLPAKKLKKVTTAKNGQVLRFTPTKAQRKKRLIAEALVRHRSGASSANAEQVVAAEATSQSAAKRGTRQQVRSEAVAAPAEPVTDGEVVAAAASGTSFCDLFASVDDNTPIDVGPATLTVGTVSVSASGCSASDAEISFTGGTLSIDGVDFTDLEGSITSSQLTLSAGSVTLPGMPDGLTLSALSLTATYSSSGLGSLSGSVTLGGFPYISLPGGWSPSSVTLTVSTDGGVTAAFTMVGPNSGSITISGSFDETSFSLTVTGTNVFTAYGVDGTTATLSGSASIGLTNGSSGWSVTYSGGAELSSNGVGLDVFDNLMLESASVSFSNAGFDLAASASMPIGSTTLSLSISGAITSGYDTTFTITTDDTATLDGLDLTFNGTGTFSYTGATSTQSGQLSFNLQVSVELSQVQSLLGFQTATATAQLQNGCPPSGSGTTASCKTSSIALTLDVTGTYAFFTDDLTVDTTIFVDTASGDWQFSVSLATESFGPAEAQLTDVTFFATNDAANYTPTGSSGTLATNPCYTNDSSQTGKVFGFTATATILSDIQVTVAGIYQSGGSSGSAQYCFYGLADASNNDLAGLGMGSEVGFVYSTYSTTVANDNVIQGESPTFFGTYNLSPQLVSALDNEITGLTGLATMTMNGDTPTGFSLTGEIDTSIYIVGNSSGDEVSLELVSVGVNTTIPIGENTGVEASVLASANLTTPAGPNGIQGSLIEMTVSMGVAATTDEGAAISVSATVDNTDIQNAFGINGLTLDKLSFAGSIGFEGDEVKYDVALAAVVGLPASITDPIGMVAETPVGFTLSVGDDNPCFQFNIGQPTDTTSVINWGQIIKAEYINLVVAPLGNCTFGTVTYNDTFQLDMNGTILDTPTQITAAFELTDGFTMDANINVGSFNLAGMSVQNTKVNLNVAGTNTTGAEVGAQAGSSQMTVSFAGGANLFGSVVVDVTGSIDVNLLTSNPSLDLQLDGNVSGNLLGIFDADANLALTADMAVTSGSFSVSQLDFTVTAGFQLLVLTGSGSLDFNYSDGAVQSISGNASIDLNLWIANISGSASFSYSNGDPNITVSATGSFTVGFWIFKTTINISKTFTIPASNITTSEYTPPPAQTIPVAGPTTNGNSWPLTYNFYQYFDFNLGSSYTNTLQENFDYLYDFTGSSYSASGTTWQEPWGTQNPSPTITGGSVSWPGAGWPTGYDALLSSWYDNLDVTANISGTSTTLGQAADGSDTTNNVEVTVTLPQSPLTQFLVANWNDSIVQNPIDQVIQCQPTTTKTITIPIPNWANSLDASGTNWTWIMMDINYRMWLAAAQEKGDMMGATGVVPFSGDWGTNENFDVPGGPIQANEDALYGDQVCGWDVFDQDSSLYDLVTSTGVPATADSVLPTYYNLSPDDSAISTNLPGLDYSSVSGMVGNLPVPSPAQYFDQQYSGGCPLTSTYVEPGHWQLNWIGCTADNLGTSPPYTTMDDFFVPLGWQSNWRPATDQTGAWWGSYSQSGSPYSMNTTVTESADGEDWSVTNLISIYFPVPS